MMLKKKRTSNGCYFLSVTVTHSFYLRVTSNLFRYYFTVMPTTLVIIHDNCNAFFKLHHFALEHTREASPHVRLAGRLREGKT